MSNKSERHREDKIAAIYVNSIINQYLNGTEPLFHNITTPKQTTFFYLTLAFRIEDTCNIIDEMCSIRFNNCLIEKTFRNKKSKRIVEPFFGFRATVHFLHSRIS